MFELSLDVIRNRRLLQEGPIERLQAFLRERGLPDEAFSIRDVLAANGVEDAVWCMRAVDKDGEIAARFAYKCAAELQHLMQPGSQQAMEVAKRFLDSKASREDVLAAGQAAWQVGADAANRPATWAAAGVLEAVERYANVSGLGERDAVQREINFAWTAATWVIHTIKWMVPNPTAQQQIAVRHADFLTYFVDCHEQTLAGVPKRVRALDMSL